jgi:hypothetical protein
MKHLNIEHEIQCKFVRACSTIRGLEWIHAIPNAVPVRIKDKEDAKLARNQDAAICNVRGALAQSAIDTALKYMLGEHSNEAALQEARKALTPKVKVKK